MKFSRDDLGATLAIIVGAVVAMLIFGTLSVLSELIVIVPTSLWLIMEIGKYIVSLYFAKRTYKYLLFKLSIQRGASGSPRSKKEISGQTILYFLLVSQFILSIGYLNEFADYMVLFIMSALFFILQLHFLLSIRLGIGVVVFAFVITLIHISYLEAFLHEGVVVISSKWPAESYYASRNWVVLMLIGSVVLDIVKLGIVFFRKRLQ